MSVEEASSYKINYTRCCLSITQTREADRLRVAAEVPRGFPGRNRERKLGDLRRHLQAGLHNNFQLRQTGNQDQKPCTKRLKKELPGDDLPDTAVTKVLSRISEDSYKASMLWLLGL